LIAPDLKLKVSDLLQMQCIIQLNNMQIQSSVVKQLIT